jgi:polar amino acid transport system permease protein
MELDRLAFTFFNPEIAREYLPDIAKGFVVTLELGLATIAAGLALGLVLAMARSFQVRAVNWLIVLFADALRAAPDGDHHLLLRVPLRGIADERVHCDVAVARAAAFREIFWAGSSRSRKGSTGGARPA